MNNSNNAIEVHDVMKNFKVFYDRGAVLRDRLLSKGRNKYELRKVLKGISFEVKKGEAIGIIGKNGCGKSTTLKLLTRIIKPSSGTIELCGRVSSLLELGAGFHPDMSGRENIYMNAAVFGLNRREIDKRVDSIIKFSEMEEFIDNPVRTYSSGMYMRLAFSVAINVDADILLIDEILAVGDISFQKKCFEKLKEIKRSGTTIVIVSHSTDQIEKICDRCIWIEDGLICKEGKPREINEEYLYKMETERLKKVQNECYESIQVDGKKDSSKTIKLNQTEENNIVTQQSDNQEKANHKTIKNIESGFVNNLLKKDTISHLGKGGVRFDRLYICDKDGKERLFFETGESFKIYLSYVADSEKLRGTICCLFDRDDGIYCYGTNTYIEKGLIVELSREGYVQIEVNKLPLLPGKYYLSFAIHDEAAINYDYIKSATMIQILSKKEDQGIARISTEWIFE